MRCLGLKKKLCLYEATFYIQNYREPITTTARRLTYYDTFRLERMPLLEISAYFFNRPAGSLSIPVPVLVARSGVIGESSSPMSLRSNISIRSSSHRAVPLPVADRRV
jgi:hypothetical protein